MNSLAQDLGAQMFAWSATALTHGLALFALVWAAERLELLRRPAARQTAWRIVLLVPLISAALQVFLLGGSPISRLLALQAPAIETAQTHAAAAIAAPVAVAAVMPENLLYQGASLIGWAWLALVAAGAVRLVVQCHGLWRYRRALTPVSDPATLAMAATLSRHAGLANVKLLDDPDLAGPIALPPRAVVLPSWTREAFTDLQKKALLAHEIRHLARRDPQWRALQGLMALATLAPHGRLALRRLEDMAEYACDAWSAHQTGAGQPLAECLALCMERGLTQRLPAGAAAMAKANSPVVDRVRRLLQGKAEGAEANVWVERALLAAAIGAAALILPGLAIGHGQRSIPTVHRTEVTASGAVPADAAVALADAKTAQADAATAEADAKNQAETAKADADAVRIDSETAEADSRASMADSDAAMSDADAARAEVLRTSADARASASAAAATAATAQEAAARARSSADATSAAAVRTAAKARASATAAADAASTAKIAAARAMSTADAARARPVIELGRGRREVVIVNVP